ncbi:MAG: hypothetical protein ACK4XY_04910 [Chloroherpetonaceae bacterium]
MHILKHAFRLVATLVCSIVILNTQVSAQTIFIDAKAGIGGTLAPTYLDWSEVLRNRRSPDLLQTLDISATALYRMNDKFFIGGDFLYKRSSEQLDTRIGFGLPAELSATWLIPSVAVAFVPIQPFKDGALVKFTFGAGVLFGSIRENVRAVSETNTYSATGVAAHSELSFGLPLSSLFTTTLNAGVRAGLTGEAKTKSTVIDDQLPTLSFISFAFSIGLVFKL